MLPSNAITFGEEQVQGQFSHPEVVSIWYSESPRFDEEFVCTGTLIERDVVLTAAHCIFPTGTYSVGYGASTLNTKQKIPVSATWRNPRYSQKQSVGDVGLLLLSSPITNVSPVTLWQKKKLNSSLKNAKKLEIAGWGIDQNGDDATYLRTLDVSNFSPLMKRYAKWWRDNVWIGVGKQIRGEGVYAGACSGDSGGPLFATYKGERVLVGVSSWGSRDCERTSPSVYTKLSQYQNTISYQGISTLRENSKTQNRLPPRLITRPTVTMSESNGGYLVTCSPGSWFPSNVKTTIRWSIPGWKLSNDASPALLLEPDNRDTQITCTVTASNQVDSLSEVVQATLPAGPSVDFYPEASGIPTNDLLIGGEVVRCKPGGGTGWTSSSDSIYVGPNSSYTASTTTRVSTTGSLILTADFIRQNGGKYLFCVSSLTSRVKTSAVASRGYLLPQLVKPDLSWATVSIYGAFGYPAPSIGESISCTLSRGSQNFSSVTSIEWLVGSTTSLSLAQRFAVGSSFVVTREIRNQIRGKYLFCQASVTNLAGTSSKSDYTMVSNTVAGPDATVDLQGVNAFETPKVGTTVECKSEAAKGSTIQSTRIETTDGNFNFSGASFLLNQETINKIVGRTLICNVRVSNDEGSSRDISSSVRILGAPINAPTPTPTPTPTLSAARQEILNGNQNTATGLVPVSITGICKLNGSVSTSPIFPKQKTNDDFWVYFGISNVSVNPNVAVNFNSITWLRSGLGFPDNITLTPEIWAQLNGKYLVVRTQHSYVRFLGFEPEGYGSILCKD